MLSTKEKTELSDVANTKEVQAKPAIELTIKQVGWSEIQYGYNDTRDFVIHFTSHHDRRKIPSNTDMVSKIIIGYLEKVIPPELKKDFYPSPENWEKKLITVIVRKAGEIWNFDEDKVVEQLEIIGDLISKEIEKNSPRQRYM